MVERTFSWFGRNRRLGKDFGNPPEPLLALDTLAPSGSLSGGLPGAHIVQRAFRPVTKPGAAGRTAARVGCRSLCQDEGDLPLAEPQIPRRNLTAPHQSVTAA
jgi:hypothetical protein